MIMFRHRIYLIIELEYLKCSTYSFKRDYGCRLTPSRSDLVQTMSMILFNSHNFENSEHTFFFLSTGTVPFCCALLWPLPLCVRRPRIRPCYRRTTSPASSVVSPTQNFLYDSLTTGAWLVAYIVLVFSYQHISTNHEIDGL